MLNLNEIVEYMAGSFKIVMHTLSLSEYFDMSVIGKIHKSTNMHQGYSICLAQLGTSVDVRNVQPGDLPIGQRSIDSDDHHLALT